MGMLDMDGSASLEWTELVAVALGAGAPAVGNTPSAVLPVLPVEACWRAFDALSLGSSDITAVSACMFLDAGDESARELAPAGGTDATDASRGERLNTLETMVQSVGQSGAISRDAFRSMLLDA